MDALYVLDLRTNFLSVAKIVDNRHKVIFTKNRAVVKDFKDNTTMVAERINDLFYLQESSQQAYTATDDRKLKIGTNGLAILI